MNRRGQQLEEEDTAEFDAPSKAEERGKYPKSQASHHAQLEVHRAKSNKIKTALK